VELDAEAYRALFDLSPDGVLFTSPDGRLLAANQTACEILGRAEDELRAIGRSGLRETADERWDVFLKERERDGHAYGIARWIRGDGSAIEIEMTSRLFTDSRGEQRACSVIRDVTERVGIETELKNSRARLSEAERVARIGSWEWDLTSNTTSWSDGLYHLYGLTREEFDPSFEGGLRRVFPDDREQVGVKLRTAVNERSSFSFEFRALRADGRVRVLRSQGDVVVNEAGEAVRAVGVVQDITDTLPALGLPSAGEPEAVFPVPLTPRQLEIVQLIADGMTNAAIAERLHVTEGTVKWHVKQILTKTGTANRTEAVARLLGETRTRS
jgi:PAS domain S-box-containing protein